MTVTLPGPLTQLALGVRFELEKHLRRRRLLWALLLSTAIPALFYVVPRALGAELPDSPEIAAAQALGFVQLLVIINAAFFGGDALSGELDKRTYLTLYLLPQRRSTVVAAKYLGALLATWGVVGVFYGVVALEGAAAFGWENLPVTGLTSFMLALLYCAACLGLAFFFSSATASAVISSLLTFFSLLFIIPIAGFVAMAGEVEPWWSLTFHAGLITDALGAPTGGFGPPSDYTVPDFGQGIWVWTGYAVVLLLVSRVLIVWRHAE